MFAFYIAQHASWLLMNAIVESTSLLYGSWLNYPIVRIERIDNPPVNMRSLMRCNFRIDSSI